MHIYIDVFVLHINHVMFSDWMQFYARIVLKTISIEFTWVGIVIALYICDTSM